MEQNGLRALATSLKARVEELSASVRNPSQTPPAAPVIYQPPSVAGRNESPMPFVMRSIAKTSPVRPGRDPSQDGSDMKVIQSIVSYKVPREQSPLSSERTFPNSGRVYLGSVDSRATTPTSSHRILDAKPALDSRRAAAGPGASPLVSSVVLPSDARPQVTQ